MKGKSQECRGYRSFSTPSSLPNCSNSGVVGRSRDMGGKSIRTVSSIRLFTKSGKEQAKSERVKGSANFYQWQWVLFVFYKKRVSHLMKWLHWAMGKFLGGKKKKNKLKVSSHQTIKVFISQMISYWKSALSHQIFRLEVSSEHRTSQIDGKTIERNLEEAEDFRVY